MRSLDQKVASFPPGASSASPTPPLISVVIPTFNRAPLILDAVASVQAQTWPYWELLVIDDGSTDDTVARLEALGEPRLRVIRTSHAGLAAVARNRGLREVRGDYVAFLDSDDAWQPTKLAVQCAALRAVPDARWSYTLFDHMDAAGAFLPTIQGGPWEATSGWILEPTLTGRLLPMIQTVLAETALVRDVGGFDERADFREDFDLCVRLAERSAVVAVDAPLTRIRHHKGRTTFAWPDVARWKVRAFDRLAALLGDPRMRRRARQLAGRDLRRLARTLAWQRAWPEARRAALDAIGRRPLDPRAWAALLGVEARRLLRARAAP